MKSLEECEEHFKTHIMSHAEAAERERKKFVGYRLNEMTKVILISAAVIIVGIVLSSSFKDGGLISFILLIVAPVIGSIGWILMKMFALGFKHQEKLAEFRDYYRRQVTRPMLEFMLPNLSYKADDGIDIDVIESSLIVPVYFTHGELVSKYLIESHDMLVGEFNGVKAKTSMLSLERRADRVQCDPSGGVFFRAKLQHDFEGRVVIRRKFTEKYLGETLASFVDDVRISFGKNEDKIYLNQDEETAHNEPSTPLEDYHVDDEEFENHYRVTTTDANLAKELLTAERMSHMLNVSKAGDLLVQFSFFDGYISAYFFRDDARLFDVSLKHIKSRVDNADNMVRLYHELKGIHLMATEMMS